MKRTHLQRDLGWGAAAIVLFAVTTVRPGEADAGNADAGADADLSDHRRSAVRLRRWAHARAVRVSAGERQRVTCAYPTESRERHSRRAWDTGEGSAGRVERERQRSARPAPSSCFYASSATATFITATSSVATTTTTNPTSSNRPPWT